MPLSKHYIDQHENPIRVDFEGLKALLQEMCPQVEFALVMGSAAKGIIEKRSDLDLAVLTSGELSFDDRCSIMQSISELHQGVRCDLGLLNHAEPVYRYEALKGTLLFCRDQERWLHFYSVTCREYESQMFHYEKQRRYRLMNSTR